jgi:hypothetical protein
MTRKEFMAPVYKYVYWDTVDYEKIPEGTTLKNLWKPNYAD